jgi:hypothetical protein
VIIKSKRFAVTRLTKLINDLIIRCWAKEFIMNSIIESDEGYVGLSIDLATKFNVSQPKKLTID